MLIMSLENFHTWSWSCILTSMLKQKSFEDDLVTRLVKPSKESLSLCCLKAYDAFLLQNVDSLTSLSGDMLKRTIVRIGGVDMSQIAGVEMCTKYDEDLKRVGAIISTNSKLHTIAVKNNENSVIIPNGVDLDYFKPREHLPNKRFIVGFAGNISSIHHMTYKGYGLIASALTAMCTEVELKTALYGYNQIRHTDMVPQFYHKIDCLISASVDEGCSNVIMEALACGVPVICTKVGYHGENLVHKENCLFVKRSIQAITDAILRLKTDSVLYSKLSAGGRAFAGEHHDINVVAQKYCEVINKVLTLK